MAHENGTNAGAEYVERLRSYTIGRQDNDCHRAIAALLKVGGSAESTRLRSWMSTHDSADFLQRLTGREDGRPQSILPFPYDTFAALHLQVVSSIARGEYAEAYDTQEKLVMAFLHAMEEDDFRWSQPVMVAVFVDLRRLALHADKEQRARGQKIHRCDQAADKLRQGFSKVCNDKSPLHVSKKWSSLHLINQIFKLLFSINQLSVGLVNLQRWVESPLCPNHREPLAERGFPKSQVVTYQYFSGRLALYEDDFEDAALRLHWAFAHCHQNARSNKREILRFLVPIQLLAGKLPTRQLLQKHELECYEDITEAVRHGNLQQFELTMTEHYDQFIQHGVYLVLEKLRTVILRNFFKKFYLLAPPPQHQLQLQMLSAVMRGSGQMAAPAVADAGDTASSFDDLDELECTLANLIYSGYLKGYIAHEKRILVLSKADPFPSARLLRAPASVF